MPEESGSKSTSDDDVDSSSEKADSEVKIESRVLVLLEAMTDSSRQDMKSWIEL